MQTGDNLHEMPNPVFWEKIRNYFKMSFAGKFTWSAKRENPECRPESDVFSSLSP